MKCPYRNFEHCMVEQCPSCVYEEVKSVVVEGRYPPHLNSEDAIRRGMAWKTTKTSYKFLSCKLVDNNVQPVTSKKEIVNNNNVNKTNVIVHKSIF